MDKQKKKTKEGKDKQTGSVIVSILILILGACIIIATYSGYMYLNEKLGLDKTEEVQQTIKKIENTEVEKTSVVERVNNKSREEMSRIRTNISNISQKIKGVIKPTGTPEKEQNTIRPQEDTTQNEVNFNTKWHYSNQVEEEPHAGMTPRYNSIILDTEIVNGVVTP